MNKLEKLLQFAKEVFEIETGKSSQKVSPSKFHATVKDLDKFAVRIVTTHENSEDIQSQDAQVIQFPKKSES